MIMPKNDMGRHPNKIRCNWLLDRFVANPLTLTANHTPLSTLSLLFYFKRWFRYMKFLVIVRWNLLRNPSFALTFLNFELGLFLSMWFWIEFSQKGSLCCFVFFCVCVCVFFGGVGWWRFSKKDIHYGTEECLMFSSASPCEHRSRLAWFFWCNWRWVS